MKFAKKVVRVKKPTEVKGYEKTEHSNSNNNSNTNSMPPNNTNRRRYEDDKKNQAQPYSTKENSIRDGNKTFKRKSMDKKYGFGGQDHKRAKLTDKK